MPLPLDKHYEAKIPERRDLSEDLWLVRVDPGGPFKFVAGGRFALRGRLMVLTKWSQGTPHIAQACLATAGAP